MSFHFIAAVAALGGLLFGYDTGVISGALLFIRQVMTLSATMQGIVVAIALAGAALGAAGAGSLSDRFGRRNVILTAALLFIAGALLSAGAQEVNVLLVGRFLIGLGIGVASMLTPLYLAEIAPAQDRGYSSPTSSATRSPRWPTGGDGCSGSARCPESFSPPEC
jgi:MFS family permease